MAHLDAMVAAGLLFLLPPLQLTQGSSSFLSPAWVVSHALSKEPPRFMRKHLVLSLLRVLRVNGFSCGSGFQCESDSRLTPFVGTWQKAFVLASFGQTYFDDLTSLIYHLLG